MSNLIRLPPTTNMTAQQALNSALVDTESDHLTDVLICGYTEGGELYIRSSKLNCAQAFFLASKAAQWAQNGGELLMGELHLPELWYAKAHLPTERIFKDYFCDRMCPGWSTTAFRDLHTVAHKRIAELNTKMPNEWQYVILGWELNNERTEQDGTP